MIPIRIDLNYLTTRVFEGKMCKHSAQAAAILTASEFRPNSANGTTCHTSRSKPLVRLDVVHRRRCIAAVVETEALRYSQRQISKAAWQERAFVAAMG
jgi:hypothetical protein